LIRAPPATRAGMAAARGQQPPCPQTR
jgi:hypothetical protein